MAEKTKKVKEMEENSRTESTLQNFMNDMTMLGTQVKDPNLKKPAFHYGDPSVTNYLLWLLLSEIMQLNDKLEDTE